jgi:hypothetical protein
MTLYRNHRMIAAIMALLLSALACRAATRLIILDTPTPFPSPTTTPPPTLTPFPPATLTPTSFPEASCPLLTTDILNTALEFEFTSAEGDGDETYLVTYIVNDDAISSPFYEPVPDDLKDERDDRARHEAIWNYFARLIPLEQRDFLRAFAVITDGSGDILAAVGQSSNDPEEWVLEVDILDSNDEYVLTFTLLHEFAHLLTLNASQVTPSLPIFEEPENDDIYQSELAACPQYFPGEGCSNPDSYINLFFDRFWPSLFAEWQEINSEPDEDVYYDLLDDFYDTYRDQFLTDYSATSPAEDIAESFAFFILSTRPELTSIANEKILFFYEFPELVELRRRILNQLCVEFPQ